jgi:hypothetical protein
VKNLKKKEFLEADKLLCQSVMSGLSSKDPDHVIAGFKSWWIDINEQLAAFPEGSKAH